MNSPSSIVIIGASLTGASAAVTLREEGYSGPITLVGDEELLPYERPPLSKGYLQGDEDRDSTFVKPAGWYAENNVDLRLETSAVSINTAAHQVKLSSGDALDYGALLIATGSRPRFFDGPGADLAGIRYLRRFEDSDQLRADFAHAKDVVIVGGGWIGLEVAAAARKAKLKVTVLISGTLPLNNVLGDEMAQVFADLHRKHGVELRTGVHVTGFVGADGNVSGVVLDDGTQVSASLIVVGIGAIPNVELAQAAGITTDNGIETDQHLATSAPDIWAAGDVANAIHPRLEQRLRVEHWANAQRQGAVAARAMLGQAATDDRLPYFYTDQFELGMEYVGYVRAGGYDEVITRGDVANVEFMAFWLADGKVQAGMNVNIWDVTEDIEALINRGAVVDRVKLADLNVPLSEL